MKASSELILKRHGLRSTEIRRSVIKLFSDAQVALSQSDIEDQLNDSDRITLYRTLKKFESIGILHKVVNDSNLIKYALCSDDCSEGKHVDGHIHFQCLECDQTSCLDHVALPIIATPKGYSQDSLEILMKGICKNCLKLS